MVIAVDRAGLNPKDGATHHGIFDVAFLSHIPEMTIYTPITAQGLRASLTEAFAINSPVAVRYPSGCESTDVVSRFYANSDFTKIGIRCDFEKADSRKAVIVTYGRIVSEAIEAQRILEAEGISVGIMLLEKLKPYDECAQQIKELLPEGTESVLFLEEEIRSGGAGMNLSDKLRGYFDESGVSFDILATDDDFVAHVERGQSIYRAAGVDRESICRNIRAMSKE